MIGIPVEKIGYHQKSKSITLKTMTQKGDYMPNKTRKTAKKSTSQSSTQKKYLFILLHNDAIEKVTFANNPGEALQNLDYTPFEWDENNEVMKKAFPDWMLKAYTNTRIRDIIDQVRAATTYLYFQLPADPDYVGVISDDIWGEYIECGEYALYSVELSTQKVVFIGPLLN